MIPFGLGEDEFSTRYCLELERVSQAAVELLRLHLARPVNPDVRQAELEIFLDEYGGAPSAWIYYRGRNNKVDRTDQSLFAGSSLDLALPLNGLAEFDERYFRGEFRGLHLAALALKRWFSECWWKAGGRTYAVPVTLGVHDGFGDGKVVQLS